MYRRYGCVSFIVYLVMDLIFSLISRLREFFLNCIQNLTNLFEICTTFLGKRNVKKVIDGASHRQIQARPRQRTLFWVFLHHSFSWIKNNAFIVFSSYIVALLQYITCPIKTRFLKLNVFFIQIITNKNLGFSTI